ncbi:MAG: HEAT repeat domain-containing protein [Nitrospirae bacterium]|nr:HEAT repeat domain-containing protein [Nitrospirota bacterium]
MQELIKQLSSSNIEVRREVVESMRGVKDDACIPVLLKAMEDVSWRVRKTAVDILFDEYPVGKYIQGLIQLLYIEDNAGARNSAIESLIRLGKKATAFLIEAFKTPNRDVRKFIIDVLGEQRDGRALPLMLEAIRDEDENVSATAVEHLGKVREVSVVDALIEILENGELWTAYPAADALGRIGNKKAVPHLLTALGKKPLREPVLKALGRLADPSTLPAVVPLMQDASKNIQEQALRTVEMFYHNGVDAEFIVSEIKGILGGPALDLLIRHAWSSKREVRISAILLLGLMKDEAAYGPLLDISHEEEFAEDVKNALVFIGRHNPESLLKLFDTTDTHQLRFICEVTEKVSSPVYYDVLESLLRNDDGHVRATAAISISMLKDVRAAGGLRELLVDPYSDVQESAVAALSNLGGGFSDDQLLEMLRDDDPVLRRNTAMLLGKMRSSGLVMELGFALKDSDRMVRQSVVEALSSIGTDEAVKYLMYALTDEEPSIRTAAALSLGRIGGPGVGDSLMILASDPDNSVRVAAAKSLGTLKDKAAIGTLVCLLDDRSGFVVTSAIKALGVIGGNEAREAVLSMLSASDDEIRRTAIIALSAFEDIEGRIVPFLKDRDWATRMAAVRTLGSMPGKDAIRELEKLLDTEEDPTVIKTVEEILSA